MFDRKGSHGSGAECSVPVMMCMVELSCTTSVPILANSTLLLSSRGLAWKTIRCCYLHPNWSLQAS